MCLVGVVLVAVLLQVEGSSDGPTTACSRNPWERDICDMYPLPPPCAPWSIDQCPCYVVEATAVPKCVFFSE